MSVGEGWSKKKKERELMGKDNSKVIAEAGVEAEEGIEGIHGDGK